MEWLPKLAGAGRTIGMNTETRVGRTSVLAGAPDNRMHDGRRQPKNCGIRGQLAKVGRFCDTGCAVSSHAARRSMADFAGCCILEGLHRRHPFSKPYLFPLPLLSSS
jgi:hypothetical protein